MDSATGEFAYVAIPEYNPVHPGLERPYSALVPVLARFALTLPGHLAPLNMHLDPDFEHLTYGDSGRKATQIRNALKPGDFIAFYAGLRDVRTARELVYAIIGVLEVHSLASASSVALTERNSNAHSRRILEKAANDIIVSGRPDVSGRLVRCLPIGEYRDRAYRVRRDLLEEWGGLSVADGYLQRSANIPRLLSPDRFLRWFHGNSPTLLKANN